MRDHYVVLFYRMIGENVWTYVYGLQETGYTWSYDEHRAQRWAKRHMQLYNEDPWWDASYVGYEVMQATQWSLEYFQYRPCTFIQD